MVSEKVRIEAPATLVWQILTDLPRYGEWNPFCVAAESTLKMGDPIKMKLRDYNNREEQYFEHTEYICAHEPEKKISWELPLHEAWPYPVIRDQFVEANGANGCEYYSTDAFLGPHGIHVMRFAGPWVKRAFDDTAFALKDYAEKRVRDI